MFDFMDSNCNNPGHPVGHFDLCGFTSQHSMQKATSPRWLLRDPSCPPCSLSVQEAETLATASPHLSDKGATMPAKLCRNTHTRQTAALPVLLGLLGIGMPAPSGAGSPGQGFPGEGPDGLCGEVSPTNSPTCSEPRLPARGATCHPSTGFYCHLDFMALFVFFSFVLGLRQFLRIPSL